jgi:hypothetical protein
MDLTKFSDDELWMWHAYDYAWRRVMLGDWSVPAGYDRTGEWFNQSLVEQAEAMWRKRLNRPRRPPIPKPTSDDAVRTDWREIPGQHLTTAERRLADPEIARLATRAREVVAGILKRSKAAFRAPYLGGTATEIPGPRAPLFMPQSEEPPPDPLGAEE